ELRTTTSQVMLYALDDWQHLACHLESRKVEGNRQQIAGAGVDDVAGGHIASVTAAMNQNAPFSGLERLDDDVGLLPIASRVFREQDRLRARQKLRPVVPMDRVLGIKRCHWRQRDSVCRDPRNS